MGTGPIGTIDLRQDQGKIAIQGAELPAFAYQSTTSDGWTVHQAIAVAADGWHFLWLYCQGDRLTNVWIESTDGTLLADYPASGQCTETVAQTTIAVDVPASNVGTDHLRCGADVDGPTLTVHGGTGTFTFMTDVYTVLVIGAVDCSACGGNGRFELHSLFWNPARRDLGFGVIYLSGNRDEIAHRAGYSGQVAYWLSLPSLTYVEGTSVTIDWSLAPSP